MIYEFYGNSSKYLHQLKYRIYPSLKYYNGPSKGGGLILLNSSITRFLCLVLGVAWRQRLSSLYCNYKFACISFCGVWFIPALKDSSKRSINSDWKIELPGEFQIAGTTVRYVRRGLWEKISAKGPTKIPLHLMVTLYPLFVFLKWCNRKGLYRSWKLNFDCLLPHHSVLLQHCRGWTSPAPHSKNDAPCWENRQCSCPVQDIPVLCHRQVHSKGCRFPRTCLISWTYLLTHIKVYLLKCLFILCQNVFCV